MQFLIATKLVFNCMIAIIALLVLMAAIYLDHVIQDRYVNAELAKTQQQLSVYHNNLVANLQKHIQIVRGLPSLFAITPELTQEQFKIAMEHLIGRSTQSQLRNIAAAPDMVVRYVYPIAGNEQALGLDYRQLPTQISAADRSRLSRNLVLAGPLELRQGGSGLITRAPVYLNDEMGQEYFWGIISAVIDIEAFFKASGLEDEALPIDIAIRGKDGLGVDGEVFFGEAALFENAVLTMPLILPDGYWLLVGQPKGGWKAGNPEVWQFRIWLFCIAIIIFVLLTAFVWFMFSASLANLKFRQVIESSPIPYVLVGRDRKVNFINQAFAELYGYTRDDLPTLALWWDKTDINPDFVNNISAWCDSSQEVIMLPEDSIEVSVNCKDNTQRVVLLSVSQLHNAVSRELLLVVYDITSRKLAEQKIHFSEQIFRQAHEGIVVTDTDSRILQVNPAFTQITGYSAQQALQQTPVILKSGKHNDTFFQQMWRSLEVQGYWQGEIWNRHKDGHLYALLLTISAMSNSQGTEQYYVGFFSDITQSKTQQDKLELMAHYDVLTHLPNRVLFADRFNQAMAHCQWLGTWLGVCFLDLDDFKPVNDTYGHNVGDLLLIEVAERLRSSVREEDTISRFGGDEFAILFRDINSYDQCEQLLTRLHQTLAEPYWINNQRIIISASSGIALYPMDNVDLDTLLRHADQAMYQAKMTGKNNFILFNPDLNQQVIHTHRVIQRFREALLNNELILHYQPEINMRSGEVIGVEALIRWQHPERGLLFPSEFLSVVKDDSELEFDLGLWVIESALKQLQQWQQADLSLLVSVNIAANHLHANNFIESLQHILDRYPDIKPAALQLEILESSALGDVQTLSRIIDDCRNLVGVQIALDDFGTGYSSLTHLRHLAANTVKIDQSFVQDMLEDANDYNIVDGVISLAKVFNRQVVAEGVESVEHGLMLLSMGCELAQGYQIARSMPANQILGWCKTYQLQPEWKNYSKNQSANKI